MIYSGCLDKQTVYNEYTGSLVSVPCGRCDYCVSARSSYYSGIVERAFLRYSETQVFITLTYDNENIPIYEDDGRGNFVSNRIGFPRLSTLGAKFVRPNGLRGNCFGHLCYKDVQCFLSRFRALLFKYCNRNSLIYEDYKYKYFVCGEYGPYSYRPHYHLLLFFGCSFSEQLCKDVYQMLSSSWTFGIIDVQPVTTAGVASYLSSYVAGLSSVPKILQNKYIRPFARYSSRDYFGTFILSDAEILQVFQSGTYERLRYDVKEQKFLSEFLPASFYSRYFPKCKGFGSISYTSKLYVYSYVYRYFESKGIKHDVDSVKKLKPSDVSFTLQYTTYLTDVAPLEWSYQDVRASLVCYSYCVRFNLFPWQVLDYFERIYTRCFSDGLRLFYEKLEDFPSVSNSLFSLFDVSSVLPARLDDMDAYIYDTLEYLGLDFDKAYKYVADVGYILDSDYISYLCSDGSSFARNTRARFGKLCSDLVKSKKMNDYKKSNLVTFVDYETFN